MATWEIPCSEPIDANISLAAGSATLTAAPTDVVTVRLSRGRPADRAEDDDEVEDVTVDFADRHLVVSERPRHGFSWRTKGLYVSVTMPAGSRAAVQAASADVKCQGEFDAVDVRTASGRVEVETVTGSAEISTMSGNVEILEAAEPTVEAASGRISVRHATRNVLAKSASGNITIGTADGSVTARTASGQVRVLSLARGHADLNSVSGDIEAKVVPGTGVFLDLASVTGRVSSDLDASDSVGEADLRLHCRTVSGSLHVARAAAAEMAG